jgi:Peptidase family C25/Propeptide_C25
MKKILTIVVIGIVIISGLGTIAFATHTPRQTPLTASQTTTVQFTEPPTLNEKDGFCQLELQGATTHLLEQHKPVLPIYVHTFEIPFKSTDIQITCTHKAITTLSIQKDIIPAMIEPVSTRTQTTTYVTDPSIYENTQWFPQTWYTSDLGAGRNQHNQQVTFVKVICYPLRYSPANHQVDYTEGFDITVTYTPPAEPRMVKTEYDMVIIAPKAFESTLQPLIDFKNTKGVATIFKSMEDIITEYNGTDQPEQVKLYIKDAYDTYNITYVFLAGGLKSHVYAKDKDTISAGWKAWHVPVRYVSIPNGEDEGCLCDLYYGCLYNATGAFDSWDSNGDGIFAAWYLPGYPVDKFDMYPEVYVSRCAVSNKIELKHIVKKILTYEGTGPEEKSWYTNFIGVGGRTFAYFQGQPDGEYLCQLAYNHTKQAIPALTLTKVFTTNRDIGGLVPDKKDIPAAINKGAGFVAFEGHGSPSRWDTNWFDKDERTGITIVNFGRIQNKEMYPVVVVGGCHNGMYNISMIPAMMDKEGTTHFGYGYPIYMCFSWGLILKAFGGAIGSTGCTGYGLGSGGNPVSLSAELEMNFFYEIGNGSTNLAQAHSQAIQKYLSEQSITSTDGFVITNWAVFGDPSLRFGGYSS